MPKRPNSNNDSKRPNKYRKDGSLINFKSFSPPESPGLFITCIKNKERSALNEFFDIFNDICERHYPNVEVELKKPKQDTVEQEEPSKDENNNDNDNDIKKELEKELNELSNVTKNDRTGQIKRFVNHNTDTQCLLYIEVRKPFDPVRLVNIYLDEVYNTGFTKSKYIQRLTPISHLCPATLPALNASASKILHRDLSIDDDEQKGYKFRIEIRTRSHNTLKREDVIKTVLETITEPHTADYKQPQKWIIVELFKSVCGIAVVSNYDKYKKFNPSAVIEEKNKSIANDKPNNENT